MAIGTIINQHRDTSRWVLEISKATGNADNRHAMALDNLLKGLRSAAIEDQVKELVPFLGNDITAVMVKAKYFVNAVCTNSNMVTGDLVNFGEFRDTGNSTKSFRPEVTLSTDMNGKENVTGFWYYTRDTGGAGVAQVGCGFFDGNNVLMGWLSSGSLETVRIASAGSGQAGGTTTSFAGFHGGLNNSNRTSQYYQNGVAIGSVGPTASGTFAVQSNYRVLAQGNISGGALNYWTRSMGFWAITDNLAANCPIAQAASSFYQAVLQFSRILGRA